MRLRSVMILLVGLMAAHVTVAETADTSVAATQLARPDLSAPTVVDVDIFLIDIVAVDDVKQLFRVDMFMVVGWKDGRLALPPEQRTGSLRPMPMDKIWTPGGLIVNDRGLQAQLARVAEVDDSGNVTYRQRIYGELATNLEFKEFPFDEQQLIIDLISYRYGPEELKLNPSKFAGAANGFSAEGWRFEMLEPEVSEYFVPEVNVSKSRLIFKVKAIRDSEYYLLTMMLPMSLIVFMAWTVFWIQPEVVPSRIAISTASIFSLIAFGFSVRLGLPRVSYMTRADVFVLGCTLLVFIALAVAVIGSRWAGSDRLERAIKLNAIARWAYVGLFGLVVFAALNI